MTHDRLQLSWAMRDENEAIPLYAKVQSFLRDAIRGGALPAGAPLPSEKELGTAHGVSRITIRRAMEELEREGLVSRGRGRQARVTEALVSVARTEIEEELATLLELVRGTQARVLVFKWSLPSAAIAEKLHAPADEPVLQVDRVRTSNGEAVFHTTAFTPAPIGAHLRRATLERETMLESLSKSGVVIARAVQDMRAMPCPAAVAPLIGLRPDDPAFVIQRLVSDRDGSPVQFMVATFRWDSFSYRITSASNGDGRRVAMEGNGRIRPPR